MTDTSTVTPLEHLTKVLRLGTPSEYRSHTYINGESMYFPTGRVYGGQVIAQSVIAAAKTVPGSRLQETYARICYLTWRRCATGGRSRHDG